MNTQSRSKNSGKVNALVLPKETHISVGRKDSSVSKYDYNVPIAKTVRLVEWVSEEIYASMGSFVSTVDLFEAYKKDVEKDSQVASDQFSKKIGEVILACNIKTCKVRTAEGRGYTGIDLRSKQN